MLAVGAMSRVILSVSERSSGRARTMYFTASMYIPRAEMSVVSMSSRVRAVVARVTPALAVSRSTFFPDAMEACSFADRDCAFLGMEMTRDMVRSSGAVFGVVLPDAIIVVALLSTESVLNEE